MTTPIRPLYDVEEAPGAVVECADGEGSALIGVGCAPAALDMEGRFGPLVGGLVGLPGVPVHEVAEKRAAVPASAFGGYAELFPDHVIKAKRPPGITARRHTHTSSCHDTPA